MPLQNSACPTFVSGRDGGWAQTSCWIAQKRIIGHAQHTMRVPPRKDGPNAVSGMLPPITLCDYQPSAEQILVESRCQYCGSRIVSSVFDGLEEMEAEHRIKCSRLPEKMGNNLFRAV